MSHILIIPAPQLIRVGSEVYEQPEPSEKLQAGPLAIINPSHAVLLEGYFIPTTIAKRFLERLKEPREIVRDTIGQDTAQATAFLSLRTHTPQQIYQVDVFKPFLSIVTDGIPICLAGHRDGSIEGIFVQKNRFDQWFGLRADNSDRSFETLCGVFKGGLDVFHSSRGRFRNVPWKPAEPIVFDLSLARAYREAVALVGVRRD